MTAVEPVRAAHPDAVTARIRTDAPAPPRSAPPGPAAPSPERSVAGLRIAAGAALIAFPVLELAGMVTSPSQEGDSDAAYVASLGADPALTALSAGLLHYSWVAFALGVLATIGLVRGRKGRVATAVAAVVTSFSAIQLSGMLLGDFYASSLARALPLDQATAIFMAPDADLWYSTWLQSGRFVGFVGVPLLVAALARAGVISWWWLAAPVAGFAGMFVLPAATAALGVGDLVGVGIGMFVGALPMVVIGLRLIQRASSRVRAQELTV